MKQSLRWVPPPNWPPLPADFQPAAGWQPDPSWEAPPPGWQFWQPAPEDERDLWKPALLGMGIMAALIVLAIGAYTVLKNTGITARDVDPKQVEQSIADHFTKISDKQVTVTCPRIKAGKGKISDCTATVASTGKSSPVFVTQIDNDGHYTFQAADPFVFVDLP